MKVLKEHLHYIILLIIFLIIHLSVNTTISHIFSWLSRSIFFSFFFFFFVKREPNYKIKNKNKVEVDVNNVKWSVWEVIKETLKKNRSNHRMCYVIKGVLRNFTKFWSEACNFIKKKTLPPVFSCAFCKISKNTFTEYLWETVSEKKEKQCYLAICVKWFRKEEI